MSDRDDWVDDMEAFKEEGAFVTMLAGDGAYTDFQLTPEEVQGMLNGIAETEES